MRHARTEGACTQGHKEYIHTEDTRSTYSKHNGHKEYITVNTTNTRSTYSKHNGHKEYIQ